MLQFPRWRVDVTVGGDHVKTTYETATTSAAAIAKAKHKMRGAVSGAGAFKFKATKVEAGTPEQHHATKKNEIRYVYRGPVERGSGRGYRWHDGYSADSPTGGVQYPWMTKREAQSDAKAHGARAVFVHEQGPSTKRHHATKKSPAQLQREIDEELAKSPSKSKSATIIVYSRPSGYWYAQAHDATTGTQITDASGYSREDVLRALRGKFAMIGVTIKSITDEDPYDTAKAKPRSSRSHATKRAISREGRTLVEAAAAGDAYQVSTLDGRHSLFMPGSRGLKETLRNARKNWKHRIGERIRIYRVLPGSRTGAMRLEEAGEATL